MTVSDLSPDALARLEMKLMADLEIVRRVRALLEEHRTALGIQNPPAAQMSPVSGGTTTALPSAATAPEPRKSPEETFTECLKALPESGFTVQNFKRTLRKISDMTPKDSSVKTFFNRMIRKGHVVVLETRVGRGGSLYRCTLPRTEPAAVPPDQEVPPDAPSTPPAESADPSPAALQ